MIDTVNSSNALIARLQHQIAEVIAPVLDTAESYVLFDFPDHDNVGDSAIFLGELAYFKRAGRQIRYICRADQCDYDRLDDELGDALILIHGGGNFGDLYPWHHNRRLELLRRFKGRRIVQMPQTIHFHSDEALKITKDAIREHGDLILLVRDHRSETFARAHFDCRVVPCPDLAFWMGAQKLPSKPKHDVLLLLRDDREISSRHDSAEALSLRSAAIVDWAIVPKTVRAWRKVGVLLSIILKTPIIVADRDRLRHLYFKQMAEMRIRRGFRLLSTGRFLITDRLHAYILSILLDIPRAIVDNSYGKLSTFVDTWMAGSDDAIETYCSLHDAISAFNAR